ncbi:collagen alpha-2(I) chain-like [Meriones unguiculatus]|uniref:collagen alpha-2(I) chain-like n=1 Tax=Meriones unguiculatus TaxID=10047 RepID=UPI00293E5CB3|nr:collagen alpha-2(I) chain-like [Meriones unguiculatus]
MAAAELRGSGDEARTWERDGASCGRRRVARGRRAGRRGRLGAHALGNLQPPGARLRPAEPGPQPPGRGGRPRWRLAASAAGCEEDRLRRRAPGSLRPRRARRGRGKRENEQAGRRHGRLRLLRFLPGRRLRRWLAGAGTVARFACHRGRKAALYGRHVTVRLSSAGRPAGGRERPTRVAGAPAAGSGSQGSRSTFLRFALRPGPRPGRGSAPRAVSHTQAHPAPAQLGTPTPPDTHPFQRPAVWCCLQSRLCGPGRDLAGAEACGRAQEPGGARSGTTLAGTRRARPGSAEAGGAGWLQPGRPPGAQELSARRPQGPPPSWSGLSPRPQSATPRSRPASRTPAAEQRARPGRADPARAGAAGRAGGRRTADGGPARAGGGGPRPRAGGEGAGPRGRGERAAGRSTAEPGAGQATEAAAASAEKAAKRRGKGSVLNGEDAQVPAAAAAAAAARGAAAGDFGEPGYKRDCQPLPARGSAAPSAPQTRRAGRSRRRTSRPRGPERRSCWAAAEQPARAAAPGGGGDRPSLRRPFPSPEAPRNTAEGGETAAGALAVESPNRLGRRREVTGDAEASRPAGSSRVDAPPRRPATSPGCRESRDPAGPACRAWRGSAARPARLPRPARLGGAAAALPPGCGRSSEDVQLAGEPPGAAGRPGRAPPARPPSTSASSRRRAPLAGGAPAAPSGDGRRGPASEPASSRRCEHGRADASSPLGGFSFRGVRRADLVPGASAHPPRRAAELRYVTALPTARAQRGRPRRTPPLWTRVRGGTGILVRG